MKVHFKDLLKKVLIESGFVWTKEEIKKIADKYDNLTDFIKNDYRAYDAMNRRGWRDELTAHMNKERKRKWTKELVQKVALKYNTFADFLKNDNGAYQAAKKYGWYDDVTSHMQGEFRWTKEMVADEAKKYNRRVDFRNGSPRAYDAALRWGWLNDVAKHMEIVGNLTKRIVYAWEFPNKSVYVGLTSDIKRRETQHRTEDNSAVFRHIAETNLTPNLVIVSSSYIDAQDAKILEDETIKQYKCDGWTILNKAKAGSLGGGKHCKIWTYEKTKEEAEKFQNFTEFKNNSRFAYAAVKRNKWYNLTDHMQKTKRKDLTYDEVQTEASKYSSIKDFAESANTEYQWAKRNNVLKLVTSHMTPLIIKWTKDMVDSEAKKYEYKKDFMTNSPKAYQAAHTNGWIDDVTKHMKSGYDLNKYTPEQLEQIAKKYNAKTEFARSEPGAYNAASKFGILDDITKHMVVKRNKWSLDKLDDEIEKNPTYTDFRKNAPSLLKWVQTYGYSDYVKNKFIEKGGSGNIKWDWDTISNEIKKFDSFTDFREKSSSAYQSARKQGLLDKVKDYFSEKLK